MANYLAKRKAYASITEYFDGRAAKFEEGAWTKNPQIIGMFEASLPPSGPCYVIDAGGGTGILAKAMQPNLPCATFINVDLSYQMSLIAKQKNISSVLADISNLPIASGRIDAILLRQVIHYLPAPNLAVNECHRVLRTGGKLLLGQFVPFDEPDQEWMRSISRIWQSFVVDFLTATELKRLLISNNFSIERVQECIAVESVAKWIGRDKSISEDTSKQIWSIFTLAATRHPDPRTIHVEGNDILFNNRFLLIEAIAR